MNQKKKCAYCIYNNPPGFRENEKCSITGCRISSLKGKCNCGKLEELNQEDFDYAAKQLPDAGNYPHDIYLVTLIDKGYTLTFRKSQFAVSNIGQYLRWELETVDLQPKY